MPAPLPICYLNGAYLPLAEARVSPLDRAFLFGDAVYEVVPVYASRPFRLREHLDRLNRSLAGIRMPAPLSHADWARLCAGTGCPQHDRRCGRRCLSVSASHPRRRVWPQSRLAGRTEADPFRLYHGPGPLPAPSMLEQGVSAVTAPETRWARRDIKSTALLANILLKKLAADAGAFETIMLENGELTEGSSTTVHVVKSGVIHTPPNGAPYSSGHDPRCRRRTCCAARRALAKQPRDRKPRCAARTRSGWRLRPAAYCRSRLSTAPRSATASPVRCSSGSAPPLRLHT